MFHILLSRYKVHRCQLFLCLIFDVLLAASPQINRKLPTAYQPSNKTKGTVRQMEKPYRPFSQRIVMSASDPYPIQTSAVRTPLYINRGFCKIGKIFPIFLSPKRKNQRSAHIYSFIFVQDNILFELLLCDLDSVTHHVNG